MEKIKITKAELEDMYEVTDKVQEKTEKESKEEEFGNFTIMYDEEEENA